MDTNAPGTFPAPEAAPRREPRRLYRSSTNRVLSGVCAGVAEYFGGDPTMVRLATAVIWLFTGIIPVTVLYIVAAIVVPEHGVEYGRNLGAAAPARPAAVGSGVLIFGVLLIAIGVAGFANEVLRIEWDLLWPFFLIGIGAAFVLATFRR
jgi:phage shock protein C